MQEKKDLKARVYEILQKHNIKQVDLAREIGIHHSTLSLWMQNKNKGHSTRIDDLLERWVTSFYANKGVGMGTGFFRLSEAKNLHLLQHHTALKPILPISKFHMLRNQYNNSIKQMKQEVIIKRLLQQQINGLITPDTLKSELDQIVYFLGREILHEPAKPLNLVPITIDIECEGRKFNQNFCWNLNEAHMSPELFARLISEESQLPSLIEQEISTQIKKQVQQFRSYMSRGNEMIKTIELDLRIDNIQIKDQFEWDMNEPQNSPEEFADQLVRDLGLPCHFKSKISQHLRQQLQNLQRQMEQSRNPTQNGTDEFFNLKKSTRSLIESSTNYQPANFKNIMFSSQVTERTCVRLIQEIHPDGDDNLQCWAPQVELLDPSALKKTQKLEDRKSRYVRRLR